MKRIHLCLLISILCSWGYAQTYTYYFDPADFSISETESGNIINCPSDFEVQSKPCTPVMPICLKNILLPDGAILKGYSVSQNIQMWKYGITLASMPYAVPTMEDDANVVDNNCQYDTQTIYPDSIAKLVNICTIDGYQYATFAISPFLYIPEAKQLGIVRRVIITLNIEQTSTSQKPQRRYSQTIKQLVDNPNDINAFYTAEDSPAQNSIEYLIITSNELKDSFEPLRVWKCQKGVNTKIVTLEEINAKYTGSTPQLRIKQCVYDYYNKGLRFLLLGGDETIVPIMRVPVVYDTIASDITPCDWYYGCFGGQFDWDANGNGIYGELEDKVDFNSSISISRLPIRTSTHMQYYTKKLLTYEQSPKNVNTMLLCAQQLWTPIGEYSDAQMKSDNMYQNYVAPYWNGKATRFYDTDTDFPEGADYDLTSEHINEQIKKGYNFIHFASHGDPRYWTIENGNKYWIYMAAQLTNCQQPSIITTMACSTNAFDDTTEPCLSEMFIRNPVGGAVAYWGSSRAGWGSYGTYLGPSFTLDAWFYKILFQNTSHHFAEIVKLAKLRDVPYTRYESCERWLMCSTNAIGDAELPIYTAGPYYFENVDVLQSDNTLQVSVPTEDCTITLSNIGQGGDYMQTYSNVSTADFTDIPEYCTLVITKHNYAPYIQTIDNCYIQNETIAQDFVITGCNEVNIGNNVVNYEPEGNVVVTNTGNLNITNFKTVNIPNGFEIKKGGQLSIDNK